MKVDNLRDLKKLIALCRTMGVEAIEVDGVKMNLGPTPVIYKTAKANKKTDEVFVSGLQTSAPTFTPGGITPDMQIPTDALTDEDLLFWSTGEQQ